MRALFFTFALLIASSLSMAWAQPVPFHAGIARISVSAVEPFDMFVWYPAHEEEAPWQAGPFSVPASRNAAIADGQFPVLLLSHGGGRTGAVPSSCGVSQLTLHDKDLLWSHRSTERSAFRSGLFRSKQRLKR
jgi:hypothetical protein